MGNSLRHLSRIHYSNVVILSKNGLPLSTISAKKAKWYLDKNLAQEVPPPAPYPRAIQINFHHKSESHKCRADLVLCEDKCVICGTMECLSLHHVIPYVIRRHFPDEEKSHSREWCVLLCVDCHSFVEKATQPLYKKNFPKATRYNTNTNLSLQMIKDKGNLNKVPSAKIALLLSRSDYKTLDDIPPLQVDSRIERSRMLSQVHQTAIKNWVMDFITAHGGIDGVKKYFAEVFLSFNPKHLPDGYLQLSNKNLDFCKNACKM